MWAQVQSAAAYRQQAAGNDDAAGTMTMADEQDVEVGPALHAIGRRVDVADLFANNK
jgi:hypothetical protein